MNKNWFDNIQPTVLKPILNKYGLLVNSDEALQIFINSLQLKLKANSDHIKNATKSFYRVLQAPEELFSLFANCVSIISSGNSDVDHLYTSTTAGNIKAKFSLALIELSRQYQLNTHNSFESVPTFETDVNSSNTAHQTISHIAGFSLISARNCRPQLSKLVKCLGSDVEVQGKYVMEPNENYIEFFKLFSKILHGELNMQNFSIHKSQLAIYVKRQLGHSINLRSHFESLFPSNTSSKEIADLYLGITAATLKPAIKEFLESNNLAPNKQSHALRVSISCNTKGEDKLNDQKKLCYTYCTVKSTNNMIACDNTNCNGQWFHFKCAGMKKHDIPAGDWYCENCKEC